MPSFPPVPGRLCSSIALALLLAGCSLPESLPRTDPAALETRLVDLEARVSSLEARQQVAPPYRSKAEIQAHIRALEDERGKLMSRYTAEHPAIRDIDRQLDMLQYQLERLEQP